MWKNFHLENTPIQDWIRIGNHQIAIKRDDISPFGFGSKIRKWNGIKNDLKTREIDSKEIKKKNILLVGSLHGNFLASFSYLFAYAGYSVTSIGLSYNPNFHSANAILTKHASKKLIIANRSNLEELKTKIILGNPDMIEIPEYGFTESAMVGLNSLWREIENDCTKLILNSKDLKNIRIYLDIGSGLSFLSAVQYFYNKKLHLKNGNEIAIDIIGIAIGESKKSWLSKWHSYLEKLNIQSDLFPSVKDIEPKIWETRNLPGFGRSNDKINHWIQTKYRETNILLEPIYSAKSLMTIEEVLRSRESNADSEFGIYVHQGGLLNFLDLVI